MKDFELNAVCCGTYSGDVCVSYHATIDDPGCALAPKHSIFCWGFSNLYWNNKERLVEGILDIMLGNSQ